jgi:hypothetical protein
MSLYDYASRARRRRTRATTATRTASLVPFSQKGNPAVNDGAGSRRYKQLSVTAIIEQKRALIWRWF